MDRDDRNGRGRNKRMDRDSRDGGRRDNREARRDGAPRKAKVARSDVEWQTYRLEVGKEHGAKPGDIVGAIANEISLDSSYIGQISLHDRHSFVQLPKGMPKASFTQLKRVKVRRQALEISVSEGAILERSAKRQPRKERSKTFLQ